jgi:hypothetical protein
MPEFADIMAATDIPHTKTAILIFRRFDPVLMHKGFISRFSSGMSTPHGVCFFQQGLRHANAGVIDQAAV